MWKQGVGGNRASQCILPPPLPPTDPLFVFRSNFTRHSATYHPFSLPSSNDFSLTDLYLLAAHSTQRSPKFYKPLILHSFALLLVFAITLSLIGLLEYVIRTLPLSNRHHRVPGLSKVLSLVEIREVAREATVTVTSATNPSAYVATAQTTSTTIPGAYVAPSVTLTWTTTAGAYTPVSSSVQPTYLATTSSGAYIPTASSKGTTSSTSIQPIQIPGAYISTVSTILPSPPLTTAIRTVLTSMLTTDASGNLRTISSYQTLDTWQPTTEVIMTHGVTTYSAGSVETFTSSFTTVVAWVPSQNGSGTGPQGTSQVETVVISWPLWKVFLGSYLPVLLAILFKVFWTSIYANVKLMEPFIQLTKPDGALARDALAVFYLSSNMTPDPLIAFFKGHWLIFWTSIVYLVAGFLAPLATESVFLDTDWGCPNPAINVPNPCWPPKLSADKVVVRILQGLLSFIAVMTLTITIMLLRSKTGVYSNPSSIAAVTSLVHHPIVLDDFRQLPEDATLKEIKTQLGGKRYGLGTYQQDGGLLRYGIIPVNGYHQGWAPVAQSPQRSEPRKPPSRTLSTLTDLLFLLFVLGLLGVIVAYFKDGSDSGFNRFFNSNAFGPRFFMVSAVSS
jgi:hypothetical protein